MAWATCGERWVAKAQGILDTVVGRRLPQFEDRENLVYIDAIGEISCGLSNSCRPLKSPSAWLIARESSRGSPLATRRRGRRPPRDEGRGHVHGP